MSDWFKDHPDAVYLIGSALCGFALRWLRGVVKASEGRVLAAIDQRKYATTDALSALRSDIEKLGTRLDQHLERCHKPKVRR